MIIAPTVERRSRAPTFLPNKRCRRGGAVRRPWVPSFSDPRAARRTAPTGCSSIYTVGAVFNRPHWRMTCAPDKNGTPYRRAIKNRPYGKHLSRYRHDPLSIINYPLPHRVCLRRVTFLLRQESHQRSGLRGGADREACRTSSIVGTLLPRLQAALPLRILSRPPTGIGWWSD